VAQLRYLGRTIINQNLIQEEIKRRLNSVRLDTIQSGTFSSPRLLSKKIKIRIYKTIILSVVLYGRETLSLTLREEHRLREFENRVLRRIFGPKRDEVMGGWRKVHNEDLHNLYSLPSMIRIIMSRKIRWTGHVARMEAKRNANRILVRKPVRKRSLERPRRRWMGNIKMDLIERMGWYGLGRCGSG
jgi:hypothetical protein